MAPMGQGGAGLLVSMLTKVFTIFCSYNWAVQLFRGVLSLVICFYLQVQGHQGPLLFPGVFIGV